MACSATCRSRFLWSSSVELLVRKLICRGKMLFHICAGTPAGALTHFCLSPQVKQRQLSIRTKAVNNAPSISAPGRIQAFEDLATQVRMDQQDPGTRIVTAGWHSVADTGMAHIYIWDLRTGEPVLNWQAHEDVINQVVLTTDDSYIVSCSGQFEPGEDVLKVDYSIKVWEASSGIQLLKLPLPSTRLNQGHLLGVKCVAVNSDSTMIISGGYDKAVCLWDMKTGKMLNRIGGLRDVQSTNATIREESKNGHTQPVTAVMFYDLADPEEVQVRRAISISDDLSIRLYDVSAAFGTELRCYGPATAQCEEPYFGGHSLPITSFAIMNNAFHQILATGSEDGSVIIWRLGRNDLTKWQTIKDRFGPKHVVAVSLLPGAALLGRVPRPLLIAASGHRSGYKRQRFTPVADTNVRVLDLETQEVMKTINTKLVHFSGTPINNVAMTPDGKHVVTSNDDGKVGVLSVQDATIVVQLPCPCICPAVLVQDPWQRCQEAPCKDGCNPSPVWPSQVVSTFALFNNPIKVTDPDSRNFQFDTLKFTFEAFCSYGKMYLIESFLRPEQRCTNDRSLCKGNRDCLSDDGNNGLCRFDPRRIDVYSNPDKSTSTAPWPPRQGIHRKPEMELGVGNKILAITGTMKDINQVLASLTYVGDEHFNTRYGLAETVTFNVSDRGALGDTLTDAQNGDGALFGKFEMGVLVESVNDSPQIGSLQTVPKAVTNPETGVIVMVDEPQLVPIDDSNSTACMSLPPAGVQYGESCAAGKRRHIDVDEDTIFTLTPDLLWIDDADSAESIKMQEAGVNGGVRKYLCDDPASVEGCNCKRACFCGNNLCRCAEPAACDQEIFTPGELLVEMRVQKGKLSIKPPPGRNMVPIKFLRNVTALVPPISTVHDCLIKVASTSEVAKKLDQCYETCPDQLGCAYNVSALLFQTSAENLQTILGEKYLTYVGNENTYGIDELHVWVADQGYTDGWYNLEKSYRQAAEKKIKIRLIGVNDPPVVEIPDYVLTYQIETVCHFDWTTQNKKGMMCPIDQAVLDESSRVPPMKAGSIALEQARAYEARTGRLPFIRVSDVDLADNPYGNLTLNIEIGLATGYFGFFTISEILSKVELYQFYRHATRTQTLQIKGRVDDINVLMERLYFSSETSQTGYAPFIVKASDNNNYGECSGSHRYLQREMLRLCACVLDPCVDV